MALMLTLEQIRARVRYSLSHADALPLDLFTTFNYRGALCIVARVLVNNSCSVGLIETCAELEPSQRAELCGVMHLGTPFAVTIKPDNNTHRHHHRSRHFIGFHTLHAADSKRMPGGSHKTTDYVAEELKRGVDFILQRPPLAATLRLLEPLPRQNTAKRARVPEL
jgi:hypothetical protein